MQTKGLRTTQKNKSEDKEAGVEVLLIYIEFLIYFQENAKCFKKTTQDALGTTDAEKETIRKIQEVIDFVREC